MTDVLLNRWKTGRYVGSAKPTQRVEVQKGYMKHGYRQFTFWDGSTEDFGEIAKNKHNYRPWQAWWVARSAWIAVPNVGSVNISGQLDASTGLADPEQTQIEIENIFYQEQTNALGGVWHKIIPGYLAPFFGLKVKHRKGDPKAAPNEWLNIFASGYRIRVWQGYGDAQEVTFMGLIDETDTTSLPRKITVNARDAGQLLTDQRVAGKVKPREVQSPIVFADRRSSESITHVGGNAKASSWQAGHEPSEALKAGIGTYWLSKGYPAADRDDHTTWIEIDLPAGDYDRFWLHPRIAGMIGWVSLYAKSGPHTACSYDHNRVPDGWVDIGAGTVPGTDEGGEPYVRTLPTMDHDGHWHKIKRFHCHDGSKLRISFRHLGYSEDNGDYRAKVARLMAERKIVNNPEAKKLHWILVDDAADVVKWVLMWAGFKEWHVEPFGVRIKNPVTFHQGDFLIDIIKWVLQQGDFVFHVRPSDNDPDQIGVPVFRRTRAVKRPSGIHEVKASNLLTGVEHKFSKEPLAWVIRCRGKPSKGKGVTLFEDRIKRYQAEYWPPWSGRHTRIATPARGAPHPLRAGRLSGVIKHVTHNDKHLQNGDECMMMAVLIALQEGLAAWRGTITIPGYTKFRLDNQISVVDRFSGVNTRMWISNRTSVFTSGKETSWTMTLEGALLDTPWLASVLDDYKAVLKLVKGEYNSDNARQDIGTAVAIGVG